MTFIQQGEPDFDGLTEFQQYILLYDVGETIKKFYEDPKNRAAFKEWQEKRKEGEKKKENKNAVVEATAK